MWRTISIVISSAILPSAAWSQQPAKAHEEPTQVEAATPVFTLDTPIQSLVADPAAKAVLDRELPGLTTHDRYEQFKGLSLKALKPFSGGLISDERLQAVEAGLKALKASAD